MSQQHARPHDRDNEESEQAWPPHTSREDTDSGNGSDYHDDNLLEEIDRLIDDAPQWETFIQKGGE